MTAQTFSRCQYHSEHPVTVAAVHAWFAKLGDPRWLSGVVVNGADDFPDVVTLGERSVTVVRDRTLPSGVFEFLLDRP